MNISLRKGEKIYMNGAIFRVDRKVCIELLNDVTFLLENHVMPLDEVKTPMKQLYFVVQTMLIAPNDTVAAVDLCAKLLSSLQSAAGDQRLVEGLARVAKHIDERRLFEALKIVRSLFPIESELLGSPSAVAQELTA
jgi:flagellar protein FlbT